MASISSIKLPNGTSYTLKDSVSGYTTNTGTVTSVAVSGGTGISISGSPITTSGTITITNSGVTGVKGSSESSYRTGQVNLTAANVGAVALSGNETVAGNKTFSGTTTLSVASTYPTQSGTIIPANSTAIIQSPMPKYLWHDIWAFNRAVTPKYYTSTDGSSWTEATLEKNLFAHKEAWGTSNVLSSSIQGSRWTWLNGGFYASTASWLVLGVTYKNPSAHFDLLLETSSDSGSTWTTLVNIADLYYSQTPIWIRNAATCQDSLRLTITWNSNSASNAILGLCSIRFLTSRWGDQGKGSEFEHPYTWDSDYNISPLSGAKFVGDVTGNVSGSAGSVAWSGVSSKPTTLSGYGITDAKIASGTITLGSNTITPLTSSSTLNAANLSGTVPAASLGNVKVSSSGSGNAVTSLSVSNGTITYTLGATYNNYSHPTYTAKSSGLYKITVDGTGHVSAATAVAKSDITGLGIPAQDTTYESKTAASGGTAVSLVTTGEKYTWNNKSDLTIGTTATTAAAGNHTHTASLATDSGTSAITLASAGKYKLTAGGSSVIFTMPTIPTVSYPVISVNNKTGAVSLTASDVGAAASSHAHGNITSGGDITATAPTIASGDQIIINDHSASKITNGPTFDGSTTTTALTPKGTWESFSKLINLVDGSSTGSVRGIGANSTIGLYAFAEGNGTTASGDSSHAEGYYTTASNSNSHAEGYRSEATNADSHAEGNSTKATGGQTHAEGYGSEASGNTSHAEGYYTKASGNTSHAEGDSTVASGSYSHAEGNNTKAAGYAAHVEGMNTTASGSYSHVSGKYNKEDDSCYSKTTDTTISTSKTYYTYADGRYTAVTSPTVNNINNYYEYSSSNGIYAEIVGNGVWNSNTRKYEYSNARTLDWSGNEVLAGKLTVGVVGTNTMDVATVGQLPNSMSGTTASSTTGITASTTATKTTLGTAFSIPNVTSVGSASTWAFENITCDDITSWSAGSGSYTQGSFSGGSGSFSATVSDHVLSFSHTHTAATHGSDSHSHTAPSLSYTARTVSSKKSGANGSAPTLGTAFSVPNVTGNTSATVSVTDNGHTHTVSVS